MMNKQKPAKWKRGMFSCATVGILFALIVQSAFGQQPLTKDDADKSSIKRAADATSTGGREEPATYLEKMLVRKDVLVIKEFFNIGVVPGQQGMEVRIEALSLAVTGETQKRYGLSFIRPAGRTVSSDRQGGRDYFCFVDFDELPAIQNALDYIIKTVNNKQASLDTEASVRSSTKPTEPIASEDATGPFWEFSILTRSGMKIGLIQIGRQNTGFVQMNYQASDTSIVFGIGALSRLKNLIGQARTKLMALGAR